MIDTNECKRQQWNKKLDRKDDLINQSAREIIRKIPILAATIKCYYRINYYGQRDCKINNRATTYECPRYSQKETLKHVIQYSETKHMKLEFIIELYKEL